MALYEVLGNEKREQFTASIVNFASCSGINALFILKRDC